MIMKKKRKDVGLGVCSRRSNRVLHEEREHGNA